MKRLYVISGCNGAGKTTASFTILPDILDCDEFVNADEIAKGLSPFNPDSTNILAGRLMLNRMKSFLLKGQNFAFETTLSTKSYVKLLEQAKKSDYNITLLFFWLQHEDLAVKRVKIRVEEGGHDIPIDVIRRRYKSGLVNFFKLYKPIVDDWMFIDSSSTQYEIIAQGAGIEEDVLNPVKWLTLKDTYYNG